MLQYYSKLALLTSGESRYGSICFARASDGNATLLFRDRVILGCVVSAELKRCGILNDRHTYGLLR